MVTSLMRSFMRYLRSDRGKHELAEADLDDIASYLADPDWYTAWYPTLRLLFARYGQPLELSGTEAWQEAARAGRLLVACFAYGDYASGDNHFHLFPDWPHQMICSDTVPLILPTGCRPTPAILSLLDRNPWERASDMRQDVATAQQEAAADVLELRLEGLLTGLTPWQRLGFRITLVERTLAALSPVLYQHEPQRPVLDAAMRWFGDPTVDGARQAVADTEQVPPIENAPGSLDARYPIHVLSADDLVDAALWAQEGIVRYTLMRQRASSRTHSSERLAEMRWLVEAAAAIQAW